MTKKEFQIKQLEEIVDEIEIKIKSYIDLMGIKKDIHIDYGFQKRPGELTGIKILIMTSEK